MYLYVIYYTVYSDVYMTKEKGTIIYVHNSTKEELGELKIIPEEPYDKVIQRLITSFKANDKGASS